MPWNLSVSCIRRPEEGPTKVYLTRKGLHFFCHSTGIQCGHVTVTQYLQGCNLQERYLLSSLEEAGMFQSMAQASTLVFDRIFLLHQNKMSSQSRTE